MTIAPRYRLPVAILASLAVVLVVLLAVLLGSGGSPTGTPSPLPSASASADPGSTPEAAVRAFFDAYARARETDDPSRLEPYVTGTKSSAYMSAAGFLKGQKDKGKASVATELRLDNMTTSLSDGSATVTFDYTEGGYNFDPATGSPLESPTVLPTVKVTVLVRLINGRWLVDTYQSR